MDSLGEVITAGGRSAIAHTRPTIEGADEYFYSISSLPPSNEARAVDPEIATMDYDCPDSFNTREDALEAARAWLEMSPT